MPELLLTLTTISLLDSTSAVPIALMPLAILLNGRSPVAGSLRFISGGFIVYFIREDNRLFLSLGKTNIYILTVFFRPFTYR